MGLFGLLPFLSSLVIYRGLIPYGIGFQVKSGISQAANLSNAIVAPTA
jgi:hypothetical protein